MEQLKCGCRIENGKFIVGEHCKESGCRECNTIATMHPFGNVRFKDIMWSEK